MAGHVYGSERISWGDYSIYMQNQFGSNWRKEIPSSSLLERDEDDTVDASSVKELYNNATEVRRDREIPRELQLNGDRCWKPKNNCYTLEQLDFEMEEEFGKGWQQKVGPKVLGQLNQLPLFQKMNLVARAVLSGMLKNKFGEDWREKVDLDEIEQEIRKSGGESISALEDRIKTMPAASTLTEEERVEKDIELDAKGTVAMWNLSWSDRSIPSAFVESMKGIARAFQ